MSTRRNFAVGLVLILCSFLLLLVVCYRSYVIDRFSSHFLLTSNEVASPTLRIIKEYQNKRHSLTQGALVALRVARFDKNTELPVDESVRSVVRPAVVSSVQASEVAALNVQDFGLLYPNAGNVKCYHTFPGVSITEDNVLLYNALCKVPSELEIVNFRGKRNYKDMGLNFSNPHIVLHGKNNVRRWQDLAGQVESAGQQAPHNKAVHVHNELKIGDFLHFILKEHIARTSVPRGQPRLKLQEHVVIPLSREEIHDAMDGQQPPIVMSNSVDENWGVFSTCMGNKTSCLINMTNHLDIHSSNYDTLRHFLDSSKVTLVLCSSHVDPLIGAHPKVVGLPLGVKARHFVFLRAKKMIGLQFSKKKLLVINNSGWGDRKRVNELVSRVFNGTVRNTYRHARRRNQLSFAEWSTNHTVSADDDYTTEIATSKFVLCPSGLGMDTYRLWETILLGAIPVVESNAGFDRSYSHLPVLVVRSFDDLTPALLLRAYPCFVKHAAHFRYEHLTQTYWRDMVQTAIETASIEHITAAHPFRNKYCDFL